MIEFRGRNSQLVGVNVTPGISVDRGISLDRVYPGVIMLYVFLSSWCRTRAIHFEFRQFRRFTGNFAGVAVGRDISVLHWVLMC